MKDLLFITIAAFVLNSAQAQNKWCSFDQHFEQMLSEDPLRAKAVSELQTAAQEIKRQRLAGAPDRADAVRVIPVVFHIIHQGGSENISDAQIKDQMRIMNEDFSRTNADTVNTRDIFKPVAADAKIEFRLAKLDPQGNCTDGIVRVWSDLTYDAPSAVKSLSYWNSNRYYNIWVVESIESSGGGMIIGYAQFPGWGAEQTDGVVIRSDYVGDIGTGAGRKGRAMAHETGHWLGLFHTFQGGCSGGDGVDDTPPVTSGGNPGCPVGVNTCSTDNPDLPDQVENYMDYTNGSCQNMLTYGQKDVMDAALSSARSLIHSAGNLAFTGVDNLNESPCQPYAFFYGEEQLTCAGANITFTDGSYNGEVTTYDWEFPGATPSSSSDANPTVSYDAVGTYSVTLTVSNNMGSDSYSRTDYIQVLPGTAEIPSSFSFEGFEETEENYMILSDGVGNTWQETGIASFTGNRAIRINNFSGNPDGSVDEFMLPSVDLTQMTSPKIFFKVSYKERTGGSSDRLQMYVSRNCGDSWSLRYTKAGGSLATVSGEQGSSFTPESTEDWDAVEIGLSNFADDEHILVKFRNTSDAGNNIYIDDIMISGPSGIADNALELDLSLSPNPTVADAKLTLDLQTAGKFNITLMDITGKSVGTLYSGSLSSGVQTFNIGSELLTNAGIYLVQVEYNGGRTVKKLVVQ